MKKLFVKYPAFFSSKLFFEEYPTGVWYGA